MSMLSEGLKDIAFMQAEIKRRCMIFQSVMKEKAAARLGLPYWSFFHMAYDDLGTLKDDAKARAWFRAHGEYAARQEAHDFARTHGSNVRVRKELEELCFDEAMKYVNGDAQVQEAEEGSESDTSPA